MSVKKLQWEETSYYIWEGKSGPGSCQEKIPVVYLLLGEDSDETAEKTAFFCENAVSKCIAPRFSLVGLECHDWNAAFSPWPGTALSKDGTDFQGKGPETLSWLMDKGIPYFQKSLLTDGVFLGKRYLLGYSLAGLFALWCLCSTDFFHGAGSCSGSLWFDGWTDFLSSHFPPSGSRIYLSLGKK